MHSPRLALRCIPLALLAVGCARDAVPAPGAHPPLVVANDNRIPAGTVRGGLLSLDLDVVMGRWYPKRDLIFTAGEDRTKVDGPVVNGGSTEAPFQLPMGRPVRMRFINIQPEWKATFEVLRDSLPVVWRPMAKDGFELPVAQGVSGQARRSLWPGETFDAEFSPKAPGTYRVRMISEKGLVAYERRIVVRP